MNDFGRLRDLKYNPFVGADQFGPEELAKLQELVGQPIPSDYAAFLAVWPATGMFDVEGSVYIHSEDRLSGNHNGDYEINMIYAACSDKRDDIREVWRNLILDSSKPRLLPLGDDLLGNLFFVDLRPESFGQIHFWDHEHGADESGLHFVASSTRAFVQALRWDGEGEA